MESLLSSSSNLFFRRVSLAAATVPASPSNINDMPRSSNEGGPGPAATDASPSSANAGTPTVVRLEKDSDDDGNAEDRGPLVVSDIISPTTNGRRSSKDKSPTTKKDDNEEEPAEDQESGDEDNGDKAETDLNEIALEDPIPSPSQTTNAIATPASTVAKGRGRTPNAKSAKKATPGRGRPSLGTKGRTPKATSAPSSASATTPTPPAKPAARVGKRKATEEAASRAETPAAKRPRGRPPAAATPGKVKTGRVGRPKKANGVAAATPAAPPLTGRQSALAAQKKAATPKETAAKPTKTTKTTTTGAKRGRKPKAETATKEAKATKGAKATKTAKAAKTAAAAAPAKRGRKPKATKTLKGEYIVEKIVDSMVDRPSMEKWFRVKWEGYPASESTWEPRQNLAGCEALVKAYEKSKK